MSSPYSSLFYLTLRFCSLPPMDSFSTTGDPPGYIKVPKIDAIPEQISRSGRALAGELRMRPRSLRGKERARGGPLLGSQGCGAGSATDARRKSFGIRALEKASDEWEVDNVPPLCVDMERLFCHQFVDMWAKRYVRDVIEHLKGELKGLGTCIPGSRCGFVVMMLMPLIKQHRNG